MDRFGPARSGPAAGLRRRGVAAPTVLAAAAICGGATISAAVGSATGSGRIARVTGVAWAAPAAPAAPRVADALPDERPVGDCDACHVPDPLFSHPVGVVPSHSVPPHLPLVAGRMTCLTCHRDATGAEHAAAASPLLRQDAASLCVQCHDPTRGGHGDLHASTIGLAHLSDPGARPARSHRRTFATLAPEGDACLTCHDGTVASGIEHRRRGGGRSRSDTIDGSHPVGIVYPLSQTVFDGAPMHPRSSLDRRVRLFDDRVECGSCHSPYSPEPDLLVMSNFASALCLSCHDE